ncbi:Pentatricopeptide repeat-containing protein [Nymphaea thermarum]|nr:Pentatricopeptide repeat-containing protein [Nymphaea thermarum]
MEEAAKMFSLMDENDTVSWSAMLTGYAQIRDSEGAARLFRRMTQQGLEPNEFTFSGVLNACSSPTAAVEQGKQLHGLVIKSCFDNAICVSSALVTMYARRGDIDHAFKLFVRHAERDIVSWNSIISCYAQHGRGKKALEVFSELENEGLQLDGITFVGVLTACNHAGLVDEGSCYFKSMTSIYHVQPTMEHYACMVDLYSRAGQLESAMSFIDEMPFPAGPTVWRTLLGGCRIHRNLKLGELAADKLMSLEPHDSAAYVLLSNIRKMNQNHNLMLNERYMQMMYNRSSLTPLATTSYYNYQPQSQIAEYATWLFSDDNTSSCAIVRRGREKKYLMFY